MAHDPARPSILISRLLPEEAVDLRRSRAEVDVHDGDAPLPSGRADRAAPGPAGPDLPDHRGHRRRRCWPPARTSGRRQRGRRLQQHRRGGRDQARRRRHQHPRRPHRDDGRLRLDAAHGHGPARGRGRPLRARGQVQAVGVHAPAGRRHPRQDPRHRRLRPHRPRHGAAGAAASACASSTRTRWPRTPPPSASSTPRAPTCATLLRESDFVTLHTPLLPETRHLINAAVAQDHEEDRLPDQRRRGDPSWTRPRWSQALKEGWIAGAGLDVFEEEPKVHPGLMGLPNVVLAPHIAQRLVRHAAQDGDPGRGQLPGRARGQDAPTPVNPEVLAQRADSADRPG